MTTKRFEFHFQLKLKDVLPGDIFTLDYEPFNLGDFQYHKVKRADNITAVTNRCNKYGKILSGPCYFSMASRGERAVSI